jgi:signal transduction histidine kinase
VWPLVAVSIAISIYSYLTLRDATRFRDRFITRRYEGSLSEDLGFLAALTTEASKEFNFESKDEQRITNLIQKDLEHLKGALDNLKALPPGQQPMPSDLSLEAITDPDTLLRLLNDPALHKLSIADLGLSAHETKEYPGRFYLQTAARPSSSFVFISAPLVEVSDGRIDLSLPVKKELVFSKLAEPYLRQVIPQTAGHLGSGERAIHQTYFIPISGFTRLVAGQAEEYGFSSLRSFSDRTYFYKTRSAQDHFRRTEPYVDVTGGGLVVTYSVFIENQALGIFGMVGIDRRLEPLKSFWGRILLGVPFGPLKDFRFGSYDSTSTKSDAAPRDDIAADIEAAVKADKDQDLQKEIRRLPKGDPTVFTVPMGNKEIGYFVFDRIGWKYTLLAILYFFALSGPLVMGWLTFHYSRATIKSERLQEEIVTNLKGGFLVVDGRDRIHISNQKFRELVGDEDIHKDHLGKYLTEETLHEYHQLKPSGGFEFTGSIRRADGSNSPVIVTSAHLAERDRQMLILIPAAELELTIAKKFLHIFSHALKTPVHSIVLIADLFRRRKAFPKFDYYFSLMQTKIREFSVLVEDVLRFSELDIKSIEPRRRPVNVAQVLRKVLSAARESADKKGLQLSYNVPESLNANVDAEMLQVVFNNLIDNALKYTDEGGVAIHAATMSSEIRISFADTGPGVALEDQEQMFDLFFQGKNSQTGKGGLGLGLYVSKKYIELHGGTLLYESGKGIGSGKPQGSEFIIQLPKTARGHLDE